MIKNIANTFTKTTRINRTEFVVGVVSLYLVLVLVVLVYSYYFDIQGLGVNYLVGKSVIELVFLVAITPLFMARLRDINWPVMVSMILFPLWLFDVRNIVVYLMLSGQKQSSGLPETLGIGLAIITIGLLLILIFKKSNSNKAPQPTPKSGAAEL